MQQGMSDNEELRDKGFSASKTYKRRIESEWFAWPVRCYLPNGLFFS